MPDAPRSMQTWAALQRAHAAVLLELDRCMERELDVSVLEHGCLYELSIAPNRQLRMADLAERLGISPSATTRLVDRLELRGWVAREIPAGNRRTIEVRVTTNGRRTFIHDNRRFGVAVEAAIGSRLTDAQMADLARLLEPLSKR